MKKILIVFGLVGILGSPSVVFAEATWYGSFRGGVESAGGSTHMKSFYSRWGVRGSNEVAEGLVANYRYEESLDLTTASLAAGNRLSYVGLSGGFGTLSIGRVWSASNNSVGSLLNPTFFYGKGGTSVRVGPAVSYANTVDAASFQVDLVMDGGNPSKSGVDHYEFGLSLDLGAATVAFAHRKKYVAAVELAGTPTVISEVVTPKPLTGTECPDGTIKFGENQCLSEEAELTVLQQNGDTAMPLGPGDVDGNNFENENDCAPPRQWEPQTEKCYREKHNIIYTVPVPPGVVFEAALPETIEVTLPDGRRLEGLTVRQGSLSDTAITMATPAYDATLNAMAIEIAAGDHTASLGFTKEKRSDNTKSDSTIASMGGPISDGVNYHFQIRATEANNGVKTNPWVLGFTKSLGAGAKMVFEHANSDDGSANEGSTALLLRVDF